MICDLQSLTILQKKQKKQQKPNVAHKTQWGRFICANIIMVFVVRFASTNSYITVVR